LPADSWADAISLDLSHFFVGWLALVLQDAARWLVQVSHQV